MAALVPADPIGAWAPPLPVDTLRHGLIFTPVTTLGDIDLPGELTGGGRHEDLLPSTVEIRLLTEVKRARR